MIIKQLRAKFKKLFDPGFARLSTEGGLYLIYLKLHFLFMKCCPFNLKFVWLCCVFDFANNLDNNRVLGCASRFELPLPS